MLPTFAPDQTNAIIEAFYRDGVAIIRQAIAAPLVARLRAIADAAIDHPQAGIECAPVASAPVLRNTQSIDPLFGEFLTYGCLPTINTALLGSDYGFCGQNVIRSGKGQAISMWHTDDTLEFPVTEGMPAHDFRERLPLLWYSWQIALSDITHPDDGPTEIVPGSHYSGRIPPGDRQVPDETQKPAWNGRAAEPVLCSAGDVYLFNHQLWHRGSPNHSGRVRYLMQNQYCRGWLLRRFFNGPHRVCSLPAGQYQALPEESRRLLPRPA